MSNAKLPLVAIIGRTNAGKSSLFNRLARFSRNDGAIVAREAGTTRDSVVREVDGFILVDTAGLKTPEDAFEATIQDQIDDAVAAADVILLTVDRTEYPDDTLKNIAKKALKSRKPVILLLNKSDLKESLPREEFLRLGVRDILEISAEHNQGIAKLREEIAKNLPKNNSVTASRNSTAAASRNVFSEPKISRGTAKPADANSREHNFSREISSDEPRNDAREEQSRELRSAEFAGDNATPNSAKSSDENSATIKLALIGRPNVGKSSLFNALAAKQQAIVAPVAGTTRDINRVKVKFKNREIEILDTAGVRRPGKIAQGIEKFSVLRTTAAIEESDICLLLLDVNELNVALDQKLAGLIADADKGLVIVVSKWDAAADKDAFTRDALAPGIAANFDFVPWAPLIFTSSITGQNVTKIFDLVLQIARERLREIPTRRLNDVLQQTVAAHPPAGLKNTHPKFRYVVQTDVAPPWFVVFGSNFKFIHWSYKRFLENNFRREFGFVGTPIKFSWRDEKQMRANRENNLAAPKSR